MLVPVTVPWWGGHIRGIVWTPWVINLDLVKEIISEQKLTPVAPGTLSTPMDLYSMGPMNMEEGETGNLSRPIIRGGIRIPHLHYEGEIYLLSDSQWNTFSKRLINTFKEKLSKAKTVSFEQLMEISEAVSAIVT